MPTCTNRNDEERRRHLLDRVVRFCARSRLRIYLYGDTLRRAVHGEGLPENVTLVMPERDYAHFEKTARNAFDCAAVGNGLTVRSGDAAIHVWRAMPLPDKGWRQKWYIRHPNGKVDDRAAHYCLVDGKIYPIELFRSGVRIAFEGLDTHIPSGYRTLLREETLEEG